MTGYGLAENAALGWFLAFGLAGLTILIWGVLLSPRRRIDLPLGVRVVIELALFALAFSGLVRSGHAPWGWTLLVTEVVVLSWLWIAGLPPGSDPAARGGSVAGEQ